MPILVIRTLLLYLTVVFSMRIMGKRQIGEMQPSELVVAIMISDLASVPMQNTGISLLSGIIPVLTLIVTEIFMSYAGLKSRVIRKILTGEPNVIIYNGHINERALEKLRFNINDLLEQLRISGIFNLADVDTAILETNGQMSVIPKREARAVTVEDMKIKNAQREELPCILISDGRLIKSELKRGKLSEEFLYKKLKEKNLSVKDVFIASYDRKNGLFLQIKGEGDFKK